MRIIVTFILINLLTTGVPESIYMDKPSAKTVIPLTVVSDPSKPEEKQILKNLEQLKEEFPVNSELISIRIYNERREVIEKWQGKSNRVIPNSLSFLNKASEGTYTIKGILIDGSESQFLFIK
ncbi:MAG: hypothetical protein AAFQ94_28970 [Bacteroidota bacterium]